MPMPDFDIHRRGSIPPPDGGAVAVPLVDWTLTSFSVMVKCPCGKMPQVFRDPHTCTCGRVYRAAAQLMVDPWTAPAPRPKEFDYA